MSSLPLVRPHLFVPAALALIALFVLAAAHDASSGVAQAQTPPPYDAFNDRERWYHDCCSGGPDLFPLDRTYSSAGATLEPGESAPCAAIGATIWIEYIPDRSGRLSLDVSGSDFDVVVAAYAPQQGAFLPSPPGGNLNSVACARADQATSMSFDIQRGTPYWIQVGGVAGASGSARIRATCECRPPNDDFTEYLYPNELYVSAYQTESTRTATTDLATVQAGEPQPCAAIGATVWYSLYTEAPAAVELDTTASSFDTAIAVYRLPSDFTAWPVDFSDLQLVACEDDGTSAASLTLVTEDFQQYYVQVGGAAGAHGQLRITGRCEPVCPPPNDHSANAEWFDPPAGFCCVPTGGASLEAGEPRPCGDIGATVWYRITVRGDTRLIVDSAPSDFDTVLAVHEPKGASPPGALDLIDCTASTGSTRARVEFAAKANVTYLLQAGGRAGATGQLAFQLDCDPQPCPPFHDSIVNPYYFYRPYGPPYEEIFDLRGATVENGEPLDCGNMGHTAWWVTDVYPDGPAIRFLFDTKNSTMETAIAVYEAPIGALNPDGTWGIEFEDLTLLECDFQGEATRAVSRFTASPGPTGKRYYVQIGGRNSASGELHVTFDCDGGCPPENDNVAQAWTAPIGYEQTTDTRAATIETNEALPCGSMGKTIWYQLPVPTAGEFRVTTAGSNFPTVIAVYKVDQVSPPGGLSGAACVSVDGLTFSTDGVSSYYIQIGGADGAGGTLVTRVDCVAGCQATSPPGGASGGGGVVGPDTGSGGYLPAARRH